MTDYSKEGTRRTVTVKTEAGESTLNYYEAGTPTPTGGGLPLVMLHGGGPGASAWSNFGSALPGFAEHFRTLLVDQPGFGASDKPAVVGNYYRHSADHVVRLLDELGIDRVQAETYAMMLGFEERIAAIRHISATLMERDASLSPA